jgi:sporulation protein YlmC with PRC-barrel domain
MKAHYALVNELLDNQLVDADKHKLGKVDGIAIDVAQGKQPRVTHLESGALILARRLGPRWERFVAFMTRHFGVRKDPVFRVPWSQVTKTGIDIRIDIDGLKSDAFAWEHWLNDHIVRRLPFSHDDHDHE